MGSESPTEEKEEALLRGLPDFEVELPDFGLRALLDPLALREALLDVGGRLARNPRQALSAGIRWGFGMAEAATASAAKALGAEAEGPVASESDGRFADPTWRENPFYFGLLQSYLVSSRLLRDLIDAAGPNGLQTEKAAFAIEQLIDALDREGRLLGLQSVRAGRVDE